VFVPAFFARKKLVRRFQLKDIVKCKLEEYQSGLFLIDELLPQSKTRQDAV
jgi:hypothetical protein